MRARASRQGLEEANVPTLLRVRTTCSAMEGNKKKKNKTNDDDDDEMEKEEKIKYNK